jgi:hypothetical protein
VGISPTQWQRGLRRGSTAARLLGLQVRIPPGAWLSVSCECCVLSGRGLYDGPLTRPAESYRLWCVTMSKVEEPHTENLSTLGLSNHEKKSGDNYMIISFIISPKINRVFRRLDSNVKSCKFTQLDHFALRISLLHVSMHITTCKINNGTPMNFIRKEVSIKLSTVSTFLPS